ncbi:GNAT family N-acetyltransferase [Motilimonas sp. KMU-193]|uniref:GNAT family N-acetyltransferase n=1 Tax=Motilimonas sp. KMU-193 TaxID=3388668 RepID=UPI00396AF702
MNSATLTKTTKVFSAPYANDVTVSGRWVQPQQDAELIHQWMNHPLVAPYWQQDKSLAEVLAYLQQQCRSYHQVMLLEINNTPVAYCELYRLQDDPLAQHIPADTKPSLANSTMGWHFLIGPNQLHGQGLGKLLGHALIHWLFQHYPISALCCEPDIANIRMHKLLAYLQHQAVADIRLPSKRARLFVLYRAQLTTLLSPPTSHLLTLSKCVDQTSPTVRNIKQ